MKNVFKNIDLYFLNIIILCNYDTSLYNVYNSNYLVRLLCFKHVTVRKYHIGIFLPWLKANPA